MMRLNNQGEPTNMKTQETTPEGWEIIQGHMAKSWQKDGVRVWQASPQRQWVRANFDGIRFSRHKSFPTFDDAIQDKRGEKFGPTWKAEESITRDMQTGEACGVEAADVRAAERVLNG